MKTLTYLGPRNMELQDAPEPEPAAGEVRVRITATAICGSDLHGFREASPRRIPPLVMGHEVVGTVDAAGDGAAADLIGRRVVVMPVVSCGSCELCREGRPNLCRDRVLMGMNFPGGFAEACTIPATHVLPVPEGLSDEVASLTEPFANSIHSVNRAVRAGVTVLVIGAGPIGLFAARAAILAGAERTFVVDTLARRLELAAKLGAMPIAADDAAGELESETAGRGVDVVIDAAGYPSTWQLALQAVRPGGHVDAIGLGAPEGPLSYQAVVAKGLQIVGSYACLPPDFERALMLLAGGEPDVGPWITTMPLSAGAAAFEALVDRTELTKVVLVP
jgi:2-desacetyl-2-hydroxyethyl bacteriochlorophyllide A dehydrogenase